MSGPAQTRPEILAPAGDLASLRAALAAGADAVYFGLDDGFNARAKATNFSRATLPATVAEIHRAGARAYVTLNTLVFESELPTVEAIVRDVAAAGVDAVLVQDPAVALVVRAVCPALEVHASTQMTISSPEAGRFAAGLGVRRVVVPRELSVDEVRRFAADTDLELEVFIHGALCVSWSGQCLTSEAWGGRSANRGQCAQSCRMPYDLLVDDTPRDLGEVRYLLSPRDLAGVRAVPGLIEAGVASLKIEGRYKGPAYVVTAVQAYRRWAEAVCAGLEGPDGVAAEARVQRDLAEMSVAYSRGFGDGFLGGSDHQTLVDGRFPKHRGRFVGVVEQVAGARVVVRTGDEAQPRTGGLGLGSARGPAQGVLSSPLRPVGAPDDAAVGAAMAPVQVRAGVGVVFDDGRPERDEEGGPVFSVEEREGRLVLGFGRPGPDLRRVAPGMRVWLTGDPAVQRRTDQIAAQAPEGRLPVTLRVRGAVGEPLRVEAVAGSHRTEAASAVPLAPARGRGLDAALLTDKLGAFGGTPFRLESLDAEHLPGDLHLPVSALKATRRAVVESLTASLERGAPRTLAPAPVVPALRAAAREVLASLPALDAGEMSAPTLVPLCRTDAQLDAAIAAGLPEVELDWMEFVGLGKAVDRARAAGRRVTIATVRVQKPGEQGYDARIARLQPDGVLVRHWGALTDFVERGATTDGPTPVLHGDFSLNVTNGLTAAHLLGRGLSTVTAAHDLDARQVTGLLGVLPPGRVAVTLHHHIATFHTEHCVYAHLLSDGRDFRSCGRPCEAHRVALRDHTGRAHPVLVDVGCRNTVFNAEAQSAVGLVDRLVAAGVRRLRVEFVWEAQAQAEAVLAAYGDLLAGRAGVSAVRARISAHEQFGVTAGTMVTLGGSREDAGA